MQIFLLYVVVIFHSYMDQVPSNLKRILNGFASENLTDGFGIQYQL